MVQDFGTVTLTVRSDSGFCAAVDAGMIMAKAYALTHRLEVVLVTVLRMKARAMPP